MFTLIALVCGVVALASIANSRAKDRAWRYRPYRLCMNCFSVSQPLVRGNNENYCPACQRIDPVPLASPAAAEFFRARGHVAPVDPAPPKPTTRQLRLRMAGAFALLLSLACFGMFCDHQWNEAMAPAPAAASKPATPAKTVHTVDEFAALAQACGSPVSFRDKPQSEIVGGKGGVRREAKYRRAEFWFLRNQEDARAWTLTGAFPAHGDDTLDHPHALELMPCLAKVHFEVGLRDDE